MGIPDAEEKRHPQSVVSISMMPNIFMPSFETAYSFRTGAMCRSDSVSTMAFDDLGSGCKDE